MNLCAPKVYCPADRRFKVRVAPEIVLSDQEHAVLDDLSRSKLTSVRLALRARIVLLAAQGLQNKDIALALEVGRIQVSRWRERYLACGLEGIERDLPRGAPPRKVNVARLVEITTQSKPEAATHWSTRTMAMCLIHACAAPAKQTGEASAPGPGFSAFAFSRHRLASIAKMIKFRNLRDSQAAVGRDRRYLLRDRSRG